MEAVWRFDLDAFRAVHIGWHSPFLDVFFLCFSYLGLGQTPAIIAALLVLRPQTRPMWLPFGVISLVVGLGFVHLIKSLVPRDRPSNLPWAHPMEAHLHGSFPSGHTTVAFCVATTLILLTRGTPHRWMGVVAAMCAPFVGLSRIYRGVHWPTDVLGGACLGIAGALFCWLVSQTLQKSPKAAE